MATNTDRLLWFSFWLLALGMSINLWRIATALDVLAGLR